MTIDDYQGEENDIVILSLVRSNPQMRLGFCAIENRIIVALSRARHGMYILGNPEMFGAENSWWRVLTRLRECGRVQEGLKLCCANHPKQSLVVMKAADFEKVAAHGGCAEKCSSLLPRCGHLCGLKCHPFDREHRDVLCGEPCGRPRPEGCTHACRRLCQQCVAAEPSDACPSPCDARVPVRLGCGHVNEVTCHAATTDAASLRCGHREKVEAPCGHIVQKLCLTVQPCRNIITGIIIVMFIIR